MVIAQNPRMYAPQCPGRYIASRQNLALVPAMASLELASFHGVADAVMGPLGPRVDRPTDPPEPEVDGDHVDGHHDDVAAEGALGGLFQARLPRLRGGGAAEHDAQALWLHQRRLRARLRRLRVPLAHRSQIDPRVAPTPIFHRTQCNPHKDGEHNTCNIIIIIIITRIIIVVIFVIS